MRRTALSSTHISLAVDVVKLAMHKHVLVALLNVLVNFLIFLVHLWIRFWEGRIDILRLGLVLCGPTALKAGHISILQWTVLIEGTTDEVGAVGKLRASVAYPDRLALAPGFPLQDILHPREST
jgi:hypothetical protein